MGLKPDFNAEVDAWVRHIFDALLRGGAPGLRAAVWGLMATERGAADKKIQSTKAKRKGLTP